MNKALYLSLLMAGVLAFSCTDEVPAPEQNTVQTSGFIHAVYFWLDDSLSVKERETFENVLDTLATIPDITQVYYGPPAGTPRQVVDNSYDYAFIVFFKDKAGHDAYQADPVHVMFKQRYTRMIRDIRIYDNYFGDQR